jgi:hypothetical protein
MGSGLELEQNIIPNVMFLRIVLHIADFKNATDFQF